MKPIARTATAALVATGLGLAGGAQAATVGDLPVGILGGIADAPNDQEFFRASGVSDGTTVRLGMKATAGPGTTLSRNGSTYLFNPFGSAYEPGTPLFNLFWSVDSAGPNDPSLFPLFNFDTGLALELRVTGPGITNDFRDIFNFDAYFNDTANAATTGTLGSLSGLGGNANIAQNFVGFGPSLGGGVNYDLDLPNLDALTVGSVYEVMLQVFELDKEFDPLITVEFDLEVVPLPGALPLLAGGLGLLGLMGWRRRRAA